LGCGFYSESNRFSGRPVITDAVDPLRGIQ
jgi:hypothetical protein